MKIISNAHLLIFRQYADFNFFLSFFTFVKMSFEAEDEIPRSAELVEQFNILDMSIDQEDQVKGFVFSRIS